MEVIQYCCYLTSKRWFLPYFEEPSRALFRFIKGCTLTKTKYCATRSFVLGFLLNYSISNSSVVCIFLLTLYVKWVFLLVMQTRSNSIFLDSLYLWVWDYFLLFGGLFSRLFILAKIVELINLLNDFYCQKLRTIYFWSWAFELLMAIQ